MKSCCICGANIEALDEPAVLLIGKYGHPYKLCSACEGVMDKLLADESTESERRAAADLIYQNLFLSERTLTRAVKNERRAEAFESNLEAKSGTVSYEVVDFLKNLMTDKALFDKAKENCLQTPGEPTEEAPSEDGDETTPPESAEESLEETPEAQKPKDNEEDFLSEPAEKTPLGIRLAFLIAYLAVGGTLLTYGILKGAVFAIVIAAVILLLGVATVFTKD